VTNQPFSEAVRRRLNDRTVTDEEVRRLMRAADRDQEVPCFYNADADSLEYHVDDDTIRRLLTDVRA
jgi:hypothetical protein